MKLDFSKVAKVQEEIDFQSGEPDYSKFDQQTIEENARNFCHGDSAETENLKPRSVIDFDHARELIAAFDATIEVMVAEAEEFKVDSDESAREATERAGAVKGLAKRIEDRRKEIIAEPDAFTRKVNQAVKPRRDKLEVVKKMYKQKIGDFAYQKELDRREILRKQEEERAKLQAQIDADAKAKGVESLTVAPVALPAKQGPTRSESATASSVMVWDFEVVDPKEVPRYYLTVDDGLIRGAIKAGIRQIQGVRIFERAEVRVRRVG